jgi:glycosyltransferase involved in cell wall biosynthesis
MIGWIPLGFRGQEIAQRLRTRDARTRVLVNGGDCRWPDMNWVHCVHHAWPCADRGAPMWFRAKNRLAKGLARLLERRSLHSARLVIANSRRTQQDLVRLVAVSPERCRVVYLGVDSAWKFVDPAERAAQREQLGLPESAPIVLFVGALGFDCNKGIDTLLAAWQRLCRDDAWDAQLLVAGGGRGSSRWHRLAVEMGVARRVRFLGFSNDVYALLASADLLVSPVRYEAYGLNVQEAICRGVPAMVSGCAGVAERYPAEWADMVLPDPEDVDDLVRRLRLWRADLPGWRARFQRLAGPFRSHTWDKMAEQIVNCAEEYSPACRQQT